MATTENKKTILFLSRDKFPPSRVDVTVLFGDELPKKGFEIDWVLSPLEENTTSCKTQWKGHDVYLSKRYKKLGLLGEMLNRVFDVVNDVKIFKLLKLKKYDALQVKDKFLSAIIGLVAAKVFRVKFVYWLSYPYHEEAKDSCEKSKSYKKIFLYFKWKYIDYFLYGVIVKRADYVFVQSEQMKIDFTKRGVSKNKLTSVPMGISVDLLPELKPLSSDVKIAILYLGTLSRIRNLDFLIRVLELVKKKYPKANLVFLGSGEVKTDEEFLLDYARKKGLLDSIRITGQMPQPKAWKMVQDASVCVSPMYPNPVFSCSSPTKLVEYLALGKAAVANDILDQSVLIDKSGGGICVKFDEIEFSNAICTLLSDPHLAYEMGRKGREYIVENRNYGVLSESVNRVYSNVILNR